MAHDEAGAGPTRRAGPECCLNALPGVLGAFDANAVDEFFDDADNALPAPDYEKADLKVVFGRDNWRVGASVKSVANATIAYELRPGVPEPRLASVRLTGTAIRGA